MRVSGGAEWGDGKSRARSDIEAYSERSVAVFNIAQRRAQVDGRFAVPELLKERIHENPILAGGGCRLRCSFCFKPCLQSVVGQYACAGTAHAQSGIAGMHLFARALFGRAG